MSYPSSQSTYRHAIGGTAADPSGRRSRLSTDSADPYHERKRWQSLCLSLFIVLCRIDTVITQSRVSSTRSRTKTAVLRILYSCVIPHRVISPDTHSTATAKTPHQIKENSLFVVVPTYMEAAHDSLAIFRCSYPYTRTSKQHTFPRPSGYSALQKNADS